MLFMTLNLTKSVFISLPFLIAIFFSSERKADKPKFTKKQFSTHWNNNNYKTRDHLFFIKFANCNNQMFSLETPVE